MNKERILDTRTDYKKYYRNDLIGKECFTQLKGSNKKVRNEQRLNHKHKRPNNNL